ncbi:MAG: hypothetical protein AB8I08_03890 [Sandaracinaceae bacterium]
MSLDRADCGEEEWTTMNVNRRTPLGAGTLALFLAACAPPAARYEPAPDELASRTALPAIPSDVTRPLDRVIWVMSVDLRVLDETLVWLRDTVPPSPVRDRALGAAVLLAAFELDRSDLAEEGIAAFDRAIGAFPEDARLPVWRATLAFVAAYRDGNRDAVDAAYDALRQSSERYAGFSVFGFTLAVASDRDADPALVDEALERYAAMNEAFMEMQFDGDPRTAERVSRLGDWSHATYNMAGTAALIGDMHARAGNVDAAASSYYQSLHTNTAYRWPFRDAVRARLEDAAGVSERLAQSPPDETMLGVHFVGATGVDEPIRDARFGGRIGNGSCTLCHTRLDVFDADVFDADVQPVAEVGWVRGTYRAPEGVDNPMPVFFALPEDSTSPPGGFLVGRVAWTGESPAAPSRPGDAVEYLVPTIPGRWFIAAQVLDGEGVRLQGYTARELGMQRFLDVRAGEVTDITDSPPMELVAPEPESMPR